VNVCCQRTSQEVASAGRRLTDKISDFHMAQLLVFEGVERPEPVVGRAPSAPRSASTRSRRNHVVFSKVTGNGASPDPGIAPLPGAGSPG